MRPSLPRRFAAALAPPRPAGAPPPIAPAESATSVGRPDSSAPQGRAHPPPPAAGRPTQSAPPAYPSTLAPPSPAGTSAPTRRSPGCAEPQSSPADPPARTRRSAPSAAEASAREGKGWTVRPCARGDGVLTGREWRGGMARVRGVSKALCCACTHLASMLGEVQAPRACARGAPLVHHPHVHSARPTRPHERIPQVRRRAEAHAPVVATTPTAPEANRVQVAHRKVVHLRGDLARHACVRRMQRSPRPHPVALGRRTQPRAPPLPVLPTPPAVVRRALAPVRQPQQPLRLPLHAAPPVII